jgi:hypothetical protein
MKKIIKNLEIQEQLLRDLLQAREDKVNDASERWQGSEACEFWEEKTEDIETQVESLFEVIEELKTL